MLLTLDINQMAKPIVEETKNSSFFVGMLYFVKSKYAKKLNNKLDAFILSLEGAFQYTEELNHEKATELLLNTKKTIDNLYAISEDLKKDNYLDDKNISEKFQYLLKTLYKFESKLHQIIYKNTPVIKTCPELLDGISKINKRNLSKLVD
jgi:hypothetical protein